MHPPNYPPEINETGVKIWPRDINLQAAIAFEMTQPGKFHLGKHIWIQPQLYSLEYSLGNREAQSLEVQRERSYSRSAEIIKIRKI